MLWRSKERSSKRLSFNLIVTERKIIILNDGSNGVMRAGGGRKKMETNHLETRNFVIKGKCDTGWR